MSSTPNIEQQNQLPIKESQFRLKNQMGSTVTVRLLLIGQEHIRIQVILSRNCWEKSLNLDEAVKIHKALSVNILTQEDLFFYLKDSFKANNVTVETVDSQANLIFNQFFVNKPVVFTITLEQVEMNLQQNIQEMSLEFEEKLLLAEAKNSELSEEIQRLQFNSFSKILKSDEKDMVYKWMSAGKEVSHLEFLYRASEHGFQAQAFHLRCDGKGPLVCFVRSQNLRRFGGYIHLKFQKNLQAYVAANPNDSFIFSLDDKKQYLSNETSCSQAYYSNSGYGFTMGSGPDLYLSENCNVNISSSSNLSSSYGKNQDGNNQSLAGSQTFLVNEIEVFQVIYKQ